MASVLLIIHSKDQTAVFPSPYALGRANPGLTSKAFTDPVNNLDVGSRKGTNKAGTIKPEKTPGRENTVAV